MLEDLEFGLFTGATAVYFIAWAWHLRGWQQGSAALTGVAVRILWVGWVLNVAMVGLRWYRADHVPMLSAFEFVTFFAMLVIGCFLLFAVKPRNRMLGVFLVPVGLLLMIYAAFMSKVIEPELSIFKGLVLQLHILTTLLGYAAWAVTFAASICYLYLEKKEDKNPGLFDQMAYRAAFFAFAFLTLGIITGALWSDRVFGQLKKGGDPRDCRIRRPGVYVRGRGLSVAADSRHLSPLVTRSKYSRLRAGPGSCNRPRSPCRE
jgi:ABC-type transport system involved in cytochrome c biogenesis permease subunit